MLLTDIKYYFSKANRSGKNPSQVVKLLIRDLIVSFGGNLTVVYIKIINTAGRSAQMSLSFEYLSDHLKIF
jgi:hypothetical protein